MHRLRKCQLIFISLLRLVIVVDAARVLTTHPRTWKNRAMKKERWGLVRNFEP
jgi:hypothetical protein